MNKKKLIFSLMFIILIALIIIFVIQKSNKILIIVGTQAPPHTFIENGELDGITIKLAEEIFPQIGVDYEIKLIPWADAINQMKNGEADVIMDAIPTKERMSFLNLEEKELYFNELDTIDYRWNEKVIAVYKNNSGIEINNKENLREKDYRIGIINGYFYLGFNMDGLNIYSYKNSDQLLKGLDKDEINIAIASELEAKSVIKNNNFSNMIYSEGLFKSHYLTHFAFSKIKDPKHLSKIKKEVNDKIIELKETGEYNKIYNKYLNEII